MTVDLGAIRDNYVNLRGKLEGVVCGAVIKADAYGLGAVRVAAVLAKAGCDHFFVAHLDEGIAVRAHLPDHAKVFVLHGLMPGCEKLAHAHRLIPVLNGLEQIDAWAAFARRMGRVLPAAIQADTGMSRLGISPAELEGLAQRRGRLDGIGLCLVMSQLARPERMDDFSARQRERFLAVCRALPSAPASIASSAAIFGSRDCHFDVVRPGGALYGLARSVVWSYAPRPVVRLQARVVQTRDVIAGDAVGYGLSFRTDKARRVATVAIGYADGFPRILSNRGVAHLDEQPLPIIGSISMDLLTLDVSAIPASRIPPGTPVDLIGPQQTLAAFAESARMMEDEVITLLGPRVRRVYEPA
ncbi:MAG: alanine racemase [Rhizomicrobium sp.]